MDDKISSVERKELLKRLNDSDDIDIQEDLGILVTEQGVFLPKDFCICSLLNFYQSEKKLNDEEVDLLFDFAYWLELLLGVHDGRKDKETEED